MKNIIKKYRGLALLIALFIFSLHINAVFEGRNEKLQEYTAVRNQVDIQSAESKASSGSYDDMDNPKESGAKPLNDVPVSDAPWLILILGLGYGLYLLNRNELKTKNAGY